MNNTSGFGEFIRQTYRANGTIASSFDGRRLTQYDENGHVISVQEVEYGTQVAYRDGQISAICKSGISGKREITLFDDNGRVTTSIKLKKDDQVNFQDGYLSSVIKFKNNLLGNNTGVEEIQYNRNGKISSVIQKTKISGSGLLSDDSLWLLTSQTTYHDNGKLASVISYKQTYKSKRRNNWWPSSSSKEGQAVSYPASIKQYDEAGKLVVSVSLSEKDEVNFNGDKISSITRRNEAGNPLSTTTYTPNGKIASILNYDDKGKVVSLTKYDENGHPVSTVQPGDERYHDILSELNAVASSQEAPADEPVQEAVEVTEEPVQEAPEVVEPAQGPAETDNATAKIEMHQIEVVKQRCDDKEITNMQVVEFVSAKAAKTQSSVVIVACITTTEEMVVQPEGTDTSLVPAASSVYENALQNSVCTQEVVDAAQNSINNIIQNTVEKELQNVRETLSNVQSMIDNILGGFANISGKSHETEAQQNTKAAEKPHINLADMRYGGRSRS